MVSPTLALNGVGANLKSLIVITLPDATGGVAGCAEELDEAVEESELQPVASAASAASAETAVAALRNAVRLVIPTIRSGIPFRMTADVGRSVPVRRVSTPRSPLRDRSARLRRCWP